MKKLKKAVETNFTPFFLSVFFLNLENDPVVLVDIVDE